MTFPTAGTQDEAIKLFAKSRHWPVWCQMNAQGRGKWEPGSSHWGKIVLKTLSSCLHMAFFPATDSVGFSTISILGKTFEYDPLIHSFNKCIQNLLCARPFHPASLTLYLSRHTGQGWTSQGCGKNETTSKSRATYSERRKFKGWVEVEEGVWIRGNRKIMLALRGWQRKEFRGVTDPVKCNRQAGKIGLKCHNWI